MKKKITLIIFLVLSFAPIWPTMLCGDWECWPRFMPFWFGFLSMPNKEFYPDTFSGWLMISAIVLLISYFIAWLYTKIKK